MGLTKSTAINGLVSRSALTLLSLDIKEFRKFKLLIDVYKVNSSV